MSKNTKPLISVIVPVYNAEGNLNRCVNSILNQTLTDFELLLVNDGSKDSSGDICDTLAKTDIRVRVFHKENGGASSARNLGIDNAIGEYICFVDSDDYVDNTYLSAFFVDALKDDKKTFVIQRLVNINEGRYSKQHEYVEGLYVKSEFSKLFSLNLIMKRGYPFCKLYNSKILKTHNIKLNPNIHFCEDLLFMLTYLKYVDTVYLSNDINYNYISTEGSLSKKYNTYESEFLAFNLLNEEFKVLVKQFSLDEEAKDSFYKNTLGYFYLRALTTLYRPETKKPYKERIRLLNKIQTKEYLSYFEKFTREGAKINRVGYNLLRLRLFRIFDAYYFALFGLRYKFNKQWSFYLKNRHIK